MDIKDKAAKEMADIAAGASKNDRLSYIDLMETVAIFMVIMYHMTLYDYNFIETPHVMQYFRYFTRTLYAAAVPIFFFANGYLLFDRKFDLRRHIFKCIRIVVLTFVWGIIGLLTIMIIRGEFMTPAQFVKNLLTWQPVGWINHLWFMGALICVYIIFPILKSAYDNNRSCFNCFLVMAFIFTIGSTMVSLCGCLAADVFMGKNIVIRKNVFGMFNPLRGIYGYAFVYFCLGGYVYSVRERISGLAHKNIYAVAALMLNCILQWLMGIYFSHVTGKPWDIAGGASDTVFAFVNVIAVYVLSLNYRSNWTIIRLVSENTLGIYFVHMIIIQIVLKYQGNFEWFNTLAGNMLCSATVMAVCMAVIAVLKRIPWFSRLVKL